MSLGKIYKVKDVINTVLLWLQEELQSDLEPELVKTFANLSVLEEAEKVSITSDDYGMTADLLDSGSNSGVAVTGAVYTDATRTINKVAHGLIITDIGKRILLTDNVKLAIAFIESITDADNFVIKDAFGNDAASMNYTILSFHSTAYLDLSSLNIMNIVKLHSSIHNEVKKLGDIEAENILRNDFKATNKVYYYKHGETLHLIVPTGVSIGDLKLFYNTYPAKKTSDNDYFDIRDNYIPNVIQRTKKKCLEHLELIAPDNIIEPDTNAERRKTIGLENREAIDG